MMTYKMYHNLIRDALEYSSAEDFIGAVGYPVWAPDDAEKFVADLINIYNIAHMSFKDMRAACGLTQAKFSERFAIPAMTLSQWERGIRECPPYVRLMVADLLGLVTVERTLFEEEH